MRPTRAGGLAAAFFGAACLAAAAPAELLPGPLDGWTASGPVYGESLVEAEGDAPAGAADKAPGKRIQLSRDYQGGGQGLRITLNTWDPRGAQLIAYVNAAQERDPKEAGEMAAKGVVPFSFASRQGVAMKAGAEGEVTGAALLLGRYGTLTLEGMRDGVPARVALDRVTAYLGRSDLERMDAFVRETNAGGGKAR